MTQDYRLKPGKPLKIDHNAAEVRYRQCDYGWVDAGMALEVRSGQDWIALGGCGMLKSVMLAEAGYEPSEMSGYAIWARPERLAQVGLGLGSLRELWRPPYLKIA